MWVLQSHHQVDAELVRSLLKSESADARAAATHTVADERDYLPEAQQLLAEQISDEHPRVRLEAIRGLSFFANMDAVHAALKVVDLPMDSWLSYTLEHTLIALEPVWTGAYSAGTLAVSDAARQAIEQMLSSRRPGLVAEAHLAVLRNPEIGDTKRLRAYVGIENLRGNVDNGQAVFRRVCAACHKIGDVGFNFGPDLGDVGKRLSRREIHESILEPSKKVDPKFVATTIVTTDGKTQLGLVIEKNDNAVTFVGADGKKMVLPHDEIEEMTETKQSSMPENLASTLAPAEYLDIVEYLGQQQAPAATK
jgi:putative heme-binding domain-containing protein